MTTQDQNFKQARNEQMKQSILIQSDTRAEIVALLTIAREQVTLLLASQPSDYQLWSLPELQREVQRMLLQFGDKAAAQTGTAAGTAWSAGQALIDVPLAAAGVNVANQIQRLDVNQLNAMRSFMTDRIKDIGVQAINKINQEMGMVVLGVNDPSHAISRVQDILGDESRARATTIVRTEIGGVFEIANQERMLQAVEIVPGLQKQWRRSGKVHSRHSHDLTDGQIRNVDQPFIIGYKKIVPDGNYAGAVKIMHPRDPKAPAGERINCGCISLPHMAHWDMRVPGAKPYSAEELARNSTKRNYAESRSLQN